LDLNPHEVKALDPDPHQGLFGSATLLMIFLPISFSTHPYIVGTVNREGRKIAREFVHRFYWISYETFKRTPLLALNLKL